MERFDYISLIHKSLTDQISPDEKEVLQKWLDESPENRNEYYEIKIIWDTVIDEEPFLDDLEFETQRKTLEDKLSRIIRKETLSKKIMRGPMLLVGLGAITLAIALWLHFQPRPEENISLSFVSVGTLQRTLLPDSSIISINDNTSVSTKLSPTSRELLLNGDAFFEIKKDKRPFIIRSGQATISVKGTSFYASGSDTRPLEVKVISGLVEVAQEGKTWKLSNGQYLSLKEGIKSSIDTESNRNIDAWLTERLEFKKAHLRDVITEVERFYHIHCILPEHLERCHFTGTFDNTPLEEVIKVLSYGLDIEFRKAGDTYIISGKECLY